MRLRRPGVIAFVAILVTALVLASAFALRSQIHNSPHLSSQVQDTPSVSVGGTAPPAPVDRIMKASDPDIAGQWHTAGGRDVLDIQPNGKATLKTSGITILMKFSPASSGLDGTIMRDVPGTGFKRGTEVQLTAGTDASHYLTLELSGPADPLTFYKAD